MKGGLIFVVHFLTHSRGYFWSAYKWTSLQSCPTYEQRRTPPLFISPSPLLDCKSFSSKVYYYFLLTNFDESWPTFFLALSDKKMLLRTYSICLKEVFCGWGRRDLKKEI